MVLHHLYPAICMNYEVCSVHPALDISHALRSTTSLLPTCTHAEPTCVVFITMRPPHSLQLHCPCSCATSQHWVRWLVLRPPPWHSTCTQSCRPCSPSPTPQVRAPHHFVLFGVGVGLRRWCFAVCWCSTVCRSMPLQPSPHASPAPRNPLQHQCIQLQAHVPLDHDLNYPEEL